MRFADTQPRLSMRYDTAWPEIADSLWRLDCSRTQSLSFFSNASDVFMSRAHYDRVGHYPKSNSCMPATGEEVPLLEPHLSLLCDPSLRSSVRRHGAAYTGSRHIRPVEGLHDASRLRPKHVTPLRNQEPDDRSSWRSHGLPPWHSSLRPAPHSQSGVSYQPPQNIHCNLRSSCFGI